MNPQHPFIHQTSAILVACGLIVGLLPGFAAAQDQPARETLSRHGASIVPLDGPVLAGTREGAKKNVSQVRTFFPTIKERC